MIQVQIGGHGLIPRGNGLAPKKDPIMADKDLIKLMLNSGTLKLKAINPKTGAAIPLSFKNLDKIYNAFDGVKKVEKNIAVKDPIVHPHIPDKKPETRKPEGKEESKPAAEPAKKVEIKDNMGSVDSVSIPTTYDDVSTYTDNKGGKKDKDKGTLKVLNNPNA